MSENAAIKTADQHAHKNDTEYTTLYKAIFIYSKIVESDYITIYIENPLPSVISRLSTIKEYLDGLHSEDTTVAVDLEQEGLDLLPGFDT